MSDRLGGVTLWSSTLISPVGIWFKHWWIIRNDWRISSIRTLYLGMRKTSHYANMDVSLLHKVSPLAQCIVNVKTHLTQARHLNSEREISGKIYKVYLVWSFLMLHVEAWWSCHSIPVVTVSYSSNWNIKFNLVISIIRCSLPDVPFNTWASQHNTTVITQEFSFKHVKILAKIQGRLTFVTVVASSVGDKSGGRQISSVWKLGFEKLLGAKELFWIQPILLKFICCCLLEKCKSFPQE